MSVTAALVDSEPHVVPGQELVCPVRIHHTGHVVDQFTVDVLGDAAAWATVEPAVLNLYPGDTGEVLVRFQPPRSPVVAAGPVPFGIRVVSHEDAQASWVGEGTLLVDPFTDLRAELLPTTSRGRRRGRHRLEVRNLGNLPVDTEVLLADPDDQLRFRVDRSAFVVEPGATTPVRIVAVPRRRFLRGPQQTKTFQVLVLPQGDEQVSLDGAFAQRALLPSWLVPVLAAVTVLLLAAAVLWLTVLKPAVKSAARDAVAQQNETTQQNLAQARQQAQRAEQKADEAASAATGGNPAARPGGGTGAPAGGVDPNDPAALSQPVDLRIQADAAPRTDNGFVSFTAAGQPDKPLDVTDLQLQNPFGDVGIIEIRKNDKVWLRFGLENFRDYDDHFVVPVRFNKGDVLSLAVNCRNPGAKRCTPAVSVSGRTTR
ncbi:hypothetical protein ACNTMW_32865 [Planosporangium sp. 12N6]|uniref:COG1470 family protein n=1 Tax=Planosporangium spinosum TaxID=3402278 RepID=UPI003CED6EF1